MTCQSWIFVSWRKSLVRWREWARRIKHDVIALALAMRDLRTPWYARFSAALVVAYALSPIDLIPDFLPVLGLLDDLLLLPIGVLLVQRLVPREVIRDAHARADQPLDRAIGRWGAALVVTIWLLVVGGIGWRVLG